MSRAFLFILDSFGIGGAPDAARFGDEGANTLGHIAAAVPLKLPNLAGLGLAEAASAAAGERPRGFEQVPLKGGWGYAIERSNGKDTPSGHWEIAGVTVRFDWGYFPQTIPCFPASLTDSLIEHCGLPGLLGDKHASGTAIIEELGEEQMRSGKPIIYTSGDSVIQIAAHEGSFGLERLYQVCQVARELSLPMNIGRVIARPFVGSDRSDFNRTGNRKDYSITPPAPTLLDILGAAGRDVVTVGKVGDIFAHSGTGREVKASGNAAIGETCLREMPALRDGGLLMANFVDFDTLHGHRRDPRGYAQALEAFDAQLPRYTALLRAGDLLILTADHGCDPTWRGTDHTRECVPVLSYAPGAASSRIGKRESFADIGQTLATHLGVGPLAEGKSWLGI